MASLKSLDKESFKAGIYICKGNHANMWWWLEYLGYEPETVHGTQDYISAKVYASSPFKEEPEVLVIFPKTKITIPSKPDNQIVFIVLSDYDGGMSASATTQYKSYSKGDVQSLDWDGIKDWKDMCKKLYPEHRGILEASGSPSMFSYYLDNPSLIEDGDYETYEPDINKLHKLLSILGTWEGVQVYKSLTKKELYSIFLTPDRSKTAFYTYLAKGYGRSFGTCPSLWFYLDMFLEKYHRQFKFHPNLLLQKFALWVYGCNTFWSTYSNNGLNSFKSRSNKEIFTFKPSKIARKSI